MVKLTAEELADIERIHTLLNENLYENGEEEGGYPLEVLAKEAAAIFGSILDKTNN